MADTPGEPNRTMRDSFRVWNVDRVEREAVLRSSDDQHVAVPLPEAHADLFEELEGSSETVEATLIKSEGSGVSWRLDGVHGVSEKS